MKPSLPVLPPAADDVVALVDLLDEAADVRRVVLEVAVHRHDHLAASRGRSRRPSLRSGRSCAAAGPASASGRSCRREEPRIGLVLASVVDQDDLVRPSERVERLDERAVQRLDVVLLVPQGNDDRDRNARARLQGGCGRGDPGSGCRARRLAMPRSMGTAAAVGAGVKPSALACRTWMPFGPVSSEPDVERLNDRLAREHPIDDYYERSPLPIRFVEGRRLAIIRAFMGDVQGLDVARGRLRRRTCPAHVPRGAAHRDRRVRRVPLDRAPEPRRVPGALRQGRGGQARPPAGAVRSGDLHRGARARRRSRGRARGDREPAASVRASR